MRFRTTTTTTRSPEITRTFRPTRTATTLIATSLVAAFMAGGVPAYAAITSGTDSESASSGSVTAADRSALAPSGVAVDTDSNSIASIELRASLPVGHVGSTASLITDTPTVLAIKQAAADRAALAEQQAIAKAAAIKAAEEARIAAEAAAAAQAAAAQAAAAERARVAATKPPAPVFSGNASAAAAQAIAQQMIAERYGWGADQFACLVALWNHESGWNVNSYNSSSGAGGIPQALPASKMATAGADWQTNPATQISWGLGYITSRYGTACGAWQSFSSKGWY